MGGPVLQPCVISLDTSVTAQFYLESKGKSSLKGQGRADPKDVKRREALGSILAPLFMFFSPPSEPTLWKLG